MIIEQFIIVLGGISAGCVVYVVMLHAARRMAHQGVPHWAISVWNFLRMRGEFCGLKKIARCTTRSTFLARLMDSALIVPGWTLERVYMLKSVSMVAVLVLVYAYYARGIHIYELALYAVMLFIFSVKWPELYLNRMALFRRRTAEQSLPLIIDQVRLYVLAGMGLELAWRNAAATLKGLWGAEFQRTVRDIDRGVSFGTALDAFSQRMHMPDIGRLVGALRQAEHLGASVSHVLAIQGAAIRTRRRQQAEELARTAAVKITIPLVLFIFPSLLLIYLGPAVLQLMQEFRG